MSILSTPSDNFLCPKCQNKGYYPMLVKAEVPGQEEMQTVMFCVCQSGRQLRQITIEFRLSDLEDLSAAILPSIQKAKDFLHKPDEALKELQALEDQLNTLLTQLRNASMEDK